MSDSSPERKRQDSLEPASDGEGPHGQETRRHRKSLNLGRLLHPRRRRSDASSPSKTSQKQKGAAEKRSSQESESSDASASKTALQIHVDDASESRSLQDGKTDKHHNKMGLSAASSVGSLTSNISGKSTHWQDLRTHLMDPATLKRLKRELRISVDALGFGKSPHSNHHVIHMQFNRHLHCTVGKSIVTSSDRDLYHALAYSIRDLLMAPWIKTQGRYYDVDPKRIYYLSMEFYMGRTLVNSIINMNLMSTCKKALHEMGLALEELEGYEADAGLGNGGLGRLAACFLDSMATLGLPGYGYGLRYEYGIFTQRIEDGWQCEVPDAWLSLGNPWEVQRPEYAVAVRFYGYTVSKDGRFSWEGGDEVLATPFDTPVPGFRSGTVNTLRLWSAGTTKRFNLQRFSRGDYTQSVMERNMAESITRVLYPNDNFFEGKELRLKQEYFLVSATLQDILRRFKLIRCHSCVWSETVNVKAATRTNFKELPSKAAIQLNDTHPALAVPELMRLLMDEELLGWDEAWGICQEVFSYTNHTVLPEALERWPTSLIGRVLPRHLDIVYEINRRFLDKVAARWPGDVDRLRRMSIVEEDGEKAINMAKLAIVASHHVNGVSKIHSNIIKDTIFHDFYEMMPEKFTNMTNGVTPRRWLKLCNPELAKTITTYLGHDWPTHLDQLEGLLKHREDQRLLDQIMTIKHHNKKRLAHWMNQTLGVGVSADSLFDVQIKRIHEYKRQMLAVMYAVTLYKRIKANPAKSRVSRTIIIGGKAAPGYDRAKLIIKLINNVGAVINNDRDVAGRLKLVFIPDYRVTLAEKIIPAADVSEQISVAGTEASGTSNMKLMLNGAITIGTLDGANVEINDAVGDDNMFVFGMTVEQVEKLKKKGYHPRDVYEKDQELRDVLDSIRNGDFSLHDNYGIFHPIVEDLLSHDKYCVLADFRSYIDTQDLVGEAYNDKTRWAKMSLMNIAMAGRFSSDRTIRDYNTEIWKSESVPVDINGGGVFVDEPPQPQQRGSKSRLADKDDSLTSEASEV